MSKKNSKSASTLGSTSASQVAVQAPLHTDSYEGAFLEITLNPPRVKGYLNLPSKTQKSVLLKVFRNATVKYNCSSEYIYEYCKDGQIHLHGFIKMLDHGIIAGLIQDVAKCFLRCFKLSNSSRYYNSEWMRFRAPCCCIQFRYKPEDIAEWKAYMMKQQVGESLANKFASGYSASDEARNKTIIHDPYNDRPCILKPGFQFSKESIEQFTDPM